MIFCKDISTRNSNITNARAPYCPIAYCTLNIFYFCLQAGFCRYVSEECRLELEMVGWKIITLDGIKGDQNLEKRRPKPRGKEAKTCKIGSQNLQNQEVKTKRIEGQNVYDINC